MNTLPRPIKVALTQIISFGIICFAALMAKAQTNDLGFFGSIGTELDQSGILTATNWAVEPYATYARSAPKNERWGGGALAVYNVNNFLGMGLGVDYLGRFSQVSANVQLQLPTHPFKGLPGFVPQVIKDLEVTPFTLGGVGKPMSGATTDIATITDFGAYMKFGHLWGGQFNLGFAHGRWDNAGLWSGQRDHIFAGYQFGF